MMDFLDQLCRARQDCDLGELAAALRSAEATPRSLFDWAISRRGSDLFQTAHLPLWEDYVQRGDFSAETKSALLARPLPAAD